METSISSELSLNTGLSLVSHNLIILMNVLDL